MSIHYHQPTLLFLSFIFWCPAVLSFPALHHPSQPRTTWTTSVSTTTSLYSTTNVNGKKNLPASQLVSRRKSPALWRTDLAFHPSQLHMNATSSTSQAWSRTNSILTTTSHPPEVMAPAGGWPQLRAAVANGADSVYVGLTSFSARARAANFHPQQDLPQAVKYCHDHGVQLFVALNTLVFDKELDEIAQLVYDMIQANVDAVIVQDVGVVRLIQRILEHVQQQQQPRSRAKLLSVHASTQQTVTSADGVAFCRDMGATRVVLGRELSVRDIGQVWSELEEQIINTATTPTAATASAEASSSTPVELEVFVHGALCVSYSGQCFSSEAWGGRSANRGQCAQACRLPYGLVVDGTLRDFQPDLAYLLSPQDLCGLDQVPALIQSGVRCLKIEGRLKDELYVAATTRAYRQAVDHAWQTLQKQHKPQQKLQLSTSSNEVQTQQHALPVEQRQQQVTRTDLAQVFSRGQDEVHDGLTPGFLAGTQHQQLVRGRSPRHRGVHIGRVLPGSSWKSGLFVAVTGHASHLQRGDGIVVDRGMAQEEELGGTIFDVRPVNINDNNKVNATVLWVKFGREVERKWKQMDSEANTFNIRRSDGRNGADSSTAVLGSAAAPAGAHVWKTSDPSVERKLRQWSEATPPKLPVKVRVTGAVGRPLSIYIQDVQNRVAVGATDEPLQAAASKTSSVDFTAQLVKAIGTLGNTRWTVSDIDTSQLPQGVWCPISWIKEARRKAVESLEEQYDSKCNESIDAIAPNSLLDGRDIAKELVQEMKTTLISSRAEGMRLSVLARDYDQVDALCRLIEDYEYNVDEIMVDFLEVDGMREAVSRIRQVQSQQPVRVVLASPRILKPGEEGIWRTLLRLRPDALLIRSAGLLYRLNQLGGTGALVNVGGNGEDAEADFVPIPSLLGDFSLNVANALTALEFLTQHGLERVTASYDLSAIAITNLARLLGGASKDGAARRLEAVVHAKLPIFHTEHCVFARFLSKGNSYLDCGHVCTRHHVHLRDVNSGADNLVLADMGCRNTVFAAQAQSGVHSLREWKDAGIGRVRIELVDEPAEDVQLIVGGYLDVLEGRERPGRTWERLQHIRDRNGRRTGVSHGSLRNHVERRAGEL